MPNRPVDNTAQPSRPVFQSGQFEVVRDLLATYGGIYLDSTSQRVLSQALRQRMAATTCATLEAYIARVSRSAGRGELQQLAELLLNHETIFFRNMLHMQALRQVVLPQLHRCKAPHEPLRIWSAGCSTGEEPYSLAMIALETLGHPLPRPVQIWATDLSEAALAKARVGLYRGRTLTNVSPAMKQRYFLHRLDGWSPNEQVRALVTFEQLNLLEPFPAQAQGIDIIFCQNVTIYFQIATFRALIERFYDVLPDQGMLFLGFSETLWNVFDRLRLREIEGAFVYVKEPGTTQAAPPAPAATTTGSIPAIQRGSQRASASIQPQRSKRTAPLNPVDSSIAQTLLPTGQGAASPGTGVPVSGSDFIQQGRSLLDQGQADKALALLNQLPLNGPHAPQVLALIAQAHANRGDAELAVAEARRALELDMLTVEAYILLGILYVQQGQLQEATQQLERARYLNPESPLVSYNLAETYRQMNRREIALREYRNTLRKLAGYAADTLLDGVAVSWLRATCERYIKLLADEHS
jgi:chemotaxis protein methyltransferase CheR